MKITVQNLGVIEHAELELQQIPIKPATKQPIEKAQSRCHNDETN